MDRRVKRTKDAILSACMDLMMEKSYEKISISEVARKADIDRKTFYLHYNSIQDVFKEYTDEAVKNINKQLEEKGFFDNPLNFRLLFNALNTQIENNLDLHKHIALSEDYNSVWAGMDSLMVNFITDYYKGKLGMDETKTRIYCEFITNGVKGTYRSWLRGELHIALDELAEYFTTMSLKVIDI